jgi:hypothetical protein
MAVIAKRRGVLVRVIVVAGLVVLAIGVGWWRATSIVNRLLRDWAVGVAAQESDGVYRLDPAGVHVNWWRRRVVVDSIRFTTDRGVNARQPKPLADVRVWLSRCTISGVHLITLIRSAGLIASSLGCEAGSVSVEVVRRMRDSTAPAPSPALQAPQSAERAAFLVLQRSLRLPAYAPRVGISRITFPDLAFDFRLPRGRGSETRLVLQRLQWHMADFVIDPADTSAASRPLFSRTIELVANTFVAHPDSAIAVRVDLLRASLIDSTLEVRGIGIDHVGSQRYRHAAIKLAVARTVVRGIDFGALTVGQGARARRIEIDSLGIDVTSDLRLPRNPGRRTRRTPQQWIADLDLTVSLDSLVVRNGEVVYREHRAGRARPGVITFAGVQATADNIRHLVDRRTGVDTMSLAATARLQNVAPLDAQFWVPLDAPRFAMAFNGTLGAMPATALNPFVEEVLPLRIAAGRVAGIGFSADVSAGIARGIVTPRYTDLSISVTRRGSGGILGGGGVLGGAARGIASFVANRWQVRGSNPDNPTKLPLNGRIRHTFRSDQTLPGFLWASVRGGLLQVVRQ